MKAPRTVWVRYNLRSATKQLKVIKCKTCDVPMVTAGEKRAEMIKCPKCNMAWSTNRLGLKLVDGVYYETGKERTD